MAIGRFYERWDYRIFEFIPDDYGYDVGIEVTSSTSKKVVLEDGYLTVIFEGAGFKFNDDGNLSGVASSFSLSSIDGKVVSITNADHDLGSDFFEYGTSADGLKVYRDVAEAANVFRSDDTIYCSNYSDRIAGFEGNDKLYGNGGSDQLEGWSGKDQLYGGSGNDKLYGGSGNDKLYGGSGNDKLYGGSGNDKLYGGSGNDKLYGGNNNDKLYGGSGNDLLKGDAGNDALQGDAGKDTMFGGSGADKLVFRKTSDSKVTASRADIIKDFKKGTDKIDLHFIDASTKISGNNAFTFDGRKSFGTSKQGDIYYKKFNKAGTANDYTMVYIDTDADRGTEMSIKLMGLHNLTASDFVL